MSQPIRRTGADQAGVDQARYAPARYDPLSEFNQMTQRMAQLFEQQWPELPSLLGREAFTPLADVAETEDAYTIDLDLPGVDKGDIDIEVAGRRLVVSGERKEKEHTGLLRRKTRTVGRFRYEVTLPDQVNPDGIDASMSDGELHVRVPKAQSAQRRRIEVKGA
jgi:HSP20 family protein